MIIETVIVKKDDAAREAYNLLHKVPQTFMEFIKALEKDKLIYIAGGAITSVFTKQKIRDYDLYFNNMDTYNKIFDYLKSKGAKNIFSTNNAETLKWEGVKWQLIKCANGTINEIFNSFDFSICMGAYDLKNDCFIIHKNFMAHNAQRRLVFHEGTKYPICSLIRTRKYMFRGYFLTGIEYIKMALCINKIRIETWADLKFHLQGIDTLFLEPLTTALEKEGDTIYDYDKFLVLMDEVLNKYFGDIYKKDSEMEEEDSPEEA